MAGHGVQRVYINAARNKAYATQKRMSTNTLAADVKAAYANDAVIQKRYHGLLSGKWNHMMDQLHFGYTNWSVSPSSYVSNLANCWRRSTGITGNEGHG